MATRSAIGIKHGDVVKAIYCHWDGYLEHVGRALALYYQTGAKVNKLISMGDLSGIGAEIGEKHSFSERAEYLDDGIATQCTFYARDRGEEGVEYRVFDDERDFVQNFNMGEEFFYLYDKGKWYYSTGGDFKELEIKLIMNALKEVA